MPLGYWLSRGKIARPLGHKVLEIPPEGLGSNTQYSEQNALRHLLSGVTTGRMRLDPQSPQGRSTKDKPEGDLGFALAGFLLPSGRLENDHVVEIKRLRVLLHRFAVNVEF